MLSAEPERTTSASGPDAGRVSVVIPCLNEAENIQECVGLAFAALRDAGLDGEVIVVDNGSEDGSAALARTAGATVIEEPRRGYGQAYLTGFEGASGDYIVMIDADLTYDFNEIPRFVKELEGGAELVMGNRMGSIDPGAMSITSRIGNPILTGFLNLLHSTPARDAHCGLRALRRDVLQELDLRSTGMEFASEMVIRASKVGLEVHELPIELHVRGGESKLSPFRDGWRHLRLILIYNPTALFIFPGVVMVGLGALIGVAVFAHLSLFGRAYYVHTLIAASALAIVGAQVVGLGLCGRAYAVYVMGERDPWLQRMQGRLRLEHGLLLGVAIVFVGLAFGGVVLGVWIDRGFGTLNEERLALTAMTFVVIGIQVFFTSFLLSLLGLRRRP
jgi:glycosyltransferase involved in cell wall biosynthesis